MNKKPSIEDRRSRLNKLSEAVFGGPEEISREEARELLRSAGIERTRSPMRSTRGSISRRKSTGWRKNLFRRS